jgi:3-deoxy-D-manno-octulosonic-acid transferase
MLIASLFNKKAHLWIKGRKKWALKLKQWQTSDGLRFWFHAASLGEFEQGLPVMQEMKKRFPGCRIILTFFSPSGYEYRKNDPHADLITYLPLDTKYNARKFIRYIRPDAVFFIKYEFWFHYLDQLCISNTPVYLISALFRPNQVFFKNYGKWYLNQLKQFNHLFVQDQPSLELLHQFKITNSSISGDTRFDRVKAIASTAKDIALAHEFSRDHYCLVAGSTWPADEELLCRYINNAGDHMKFIIAPHEITEAHINRLTSTIHHKSMPYSRASLENIALCQVLIIDNIGMLSSLYRYGSVAYIGGGFGKGIHNILEAAVYGIPVIFGPKYQKFREAAAMIAAEAAFPVSSFEELKDFLDYRLSPGSDILRKASENATLYISTNTGATAMIADRVETNLKSANDLITALH